MRQFALDNRNSSLTDQLDNIEQSYRFLLKYLKEGAEDPSREKMFNDLRYRLYSIVRNLEIEEEAKTSPLLYFSTMRTVRYSKLVFADALGRFLSADAALQLSGLYDEKGSLTEDAKKILNEKDRALKDIFNVIWTLPVGDKPQLDAIVTVASDNDLSYQLRGVIVSALTLSILQTYDSKKVAALIDIDNRTSDQRIRARCIAGLLLAVSLYRNDLQSDYELDLRFAAWRDDLTNYPRLRDMVYAIVKTRGSAKLNERLNKEVFPDISAIGKNLFKDLKDREKPITLEELQENPEWEKALHESGLDKKLRKMHKLHDKGADMMLPMFSQLANHYFFKDIDTWFRPYDVWEASRLGLSKDVAEMFGSNPSSNIMCDTDKFALLINLGKIPQSARDMMKNALLAGREEMSEELKDMELLKSEPEFEMEAANYARTLFRFFNYFRLHREFKNPFDVPIPYSRLPYLGTILAEEEILQTIGETYFQQGFYQDAVDIFVELAKKNNQGTDLYLQKIGYCYEKSKQPEKALEYYMKAYDLKPEEDRWLNERIHEMAIRSGSIVPQLHSLNRLMDQDKENTRYLAEWLDLMIGLGIYANYPDSKEIFEKRLAKLSYLEPDNPSTISLQARAYALKGEFGKVIECLSPRRTDVEMYLGASSLGSEHVEEDEASEISMRDDMLLLSCAYAALEDYSEAILVLKLLRMLHHPFTADELSKKMNSLWLASDTLSNRLLLIPMLIEASNP